MSTQSNIHSYILLIYQMPSQPSAARVSVWRELKRSGGLYLQQSVCILPQTEALEATMQKIIERINEYDGTYHYLHLTNLPEQEEEKIVNGFIVQSNLQYDEIIEDCEVNFKKEIEFEIFRQNFTYAEAEEIRQNLDKIHRWYERVIERDWFGAGRRDAAWKSIEQSEQLLEGFEEKVFLQQEVDESNDLLTHDKKQRLYPQRLERRNTHEQV
jgi:hypothetical protein